MSSDFTAFANHVLSMKNSAIDNYAMVGLRSEVIGNGVVRMFTQMTAPLSIVTPHSHRYSLACMVLSGIVKNTIWQEADKNSTHTKYRMMVSSQRYLGEPGNYEFTEQRTALFTRYHTHHRTGESYFMNATEIHTIEFEQGTQVLFFEGPQRFEESVILEPMGDDGVIPINATMPWMFKQV